MERKNERMETLLERYFEAETTPAEERELRAYFAADEPSFEPGDELRGVRTMFGGLESLASERSRRTFAPPLPKPELQSPARPGIRPRLRSRRLAWQLGGVAAAAAIAVGLFVLTSYLNRPYCYIDGVAVRDARQAMQTTAYFERLGDMDKPLEALDELLNCNTKNEK